MRFYVCHTRPFSLDDIPFANRFWRIRLPRAIRLKARPLAEWEISTWPWGPSCTDNLWTFSMFSLFSWPIQLEMRTGYCLSWWPNFSAFRLSSSQGRLYAASGRGKDTNWMMPHGFEYDSVRANNLLRNTITRHESIFVLCLGFRTWHTL